MHIYHKNTTPGRRSCTRVHIKTHLHTRTYIHEYANTHTPHARMPTCLPVAVAGEEILQQPIGNEELRALEAQQERQQHHCCGGPRHEHAALSGLA